MLRVNTPEILDSCLCSPGEISASLRDLELVNRWFGGVRTTRRLIERIASVTGRTHFSVLEVAAGMGDVPRAAARQLERKGITLDITDLDVRASHLKRGHRSLAADALALPFREGSFDLVSTNLFTHHLEPDEVARFGAEARNVCRCAVLINDLIRNPLHLALVYAGFPLLRSYVSRADGVASVRRAYVPEEMLQMLSGSAEDTGVIEISRYYLFRMGVILWKGFAQIPRSLADD
jgi:ubiquinone/menaquinone biosynthesis C-methylase UbiE